ncbi:MAG: sodium:proline symporter [Crocinitomicaceae bacterium]|nr:sodium:proline symporter [Crocinitomicaceae bacterium]|tara:strand:+ start:15065 stop:16840 length:1776 start_codon:yes stop_codon:yes gene_type:complete
MLENIDWIIIGVYLAISLYIGYHFKEQAGKSLTDFFLGGRNMPWYVAGISMVATTFAADTPLWVTEVIAQHGISGNWLWWNMLIGGMLTTFFFSRLWRRANILTELEFIELRYGGVPAKFLRGFKSVYMGLFLNVIIIGWVNFALMTILCVFFDIPTYDHTIPFYQNEILWYIGGAMVLVAFYSSLSGLKGVAITDTMQFFIAMIGCIVMAWFVLDTPEIGGVAGLKSKLPAWRFDFFPKLDTGNGVMDAVGTYSITIGAFLTFGLVQWWASWYPGAEPGGGGYVAQRMMSTKTEKESLMATLFFQIAHYCLRPWPWIIVGLCALVLYPDLPSDKAGQGFVFIMRDYLPAGLKGLLLVAFLSAYMSTISTQLNWGASFLTNDLYKRFIRPEDSFDSPEKAQKKYVGIARLFTVLIMVVAFLVTTQIHTIDSAAKFLIQAGAGLGMVLILRWYWWRINAWSEISASLAPMVGYGLANYYFEWDFPNNFLFTVLVTTVVWVLTTYFTQSESKQTLTRFYDRVTPPGMWSAYSTGKKANNLRPLFVSWIASIVMTYCILFGVGYLIFSDYGLAMVSLSVAILAGFVLSRNMDKH